MNQWISNEMKTMYIEVDSFENQLLKGRLCHELFEEKKSFHDISMLILLMEELMDDMVYPQAAMQTRRFVKNQRNLQNITESSPEASLEESISADYAEGLEEHLEECGPLATFRVNMRYRQNASWQGQISCLNTEKVLKYKSGLEMILFITESLKDIEA